MKHRLFIILPVVLALFLCCAVSEQSKAYAVSSPKVKSTVKSTKKTVLKWNKQKVDRYVIKKLDMKTNKWKKVKVLSGKKTKYTVKTKKNKYYEYEVIAQKYKKGTKKVAKSYHGYASFYSGVTPVDFDEYCWAESPISPKKITLDFSYAIEGMSFTGIQIYRAVPGGKFKKIATRKNLNRFTDKNVTAGATYKYKVRSYRKKGKKTYYGPYSEKMTKSAVWQTGKFTMSGDPDAAEPILKVTSDSLNGDLILDAYQILDAGYRNQEGTKYYQAAAFSKDGKTWSSDGNLTVEPGESFSLKFKETEGPEFGSDENGRMYLDEIRYNRIPSWMVLLPYKGTGSAQENAEYVH